MAPRFSSFNYNKGFGSRISRGRPFFATGGTIFDDGGYRYHWYDVGSNSFIVSGAPGQIEFLIVAGGGAGAQGGGGGGGGGVVVTSSPYPISIGSYSVVVGNGAPISTANGGDSSFNNITAKGGGVGGGAGGGTGTPGGSGGGASNDSVPAGASVVVS